MVLQRNKSSQIFLFITLIFTISTSNAMVVLRNGVLELSTIVGSRMILLNQLSYEEPVAFYELVETCFDPNYKSYESSAQFLQQWNFLTEHGTVPDSLKNIILSAIKTTGVAIQLGDPILTLPYPAERAQSNDVSLFSNLQ